MVWVSQRPWQLFKGIPIIVLYEGTWVILEHQRPQQLCKGLLGYFITKERIRLITCDVMKLWSASSTPFLQKNCSSLVNGLTFQWKRVDVAV